jgi:hypothetical protein
MRKKYVIAGIVVVIIGLVLGLYGIFLRQSIEAEFPDFNMTLSHDINLTYEMGRMAEISGILIFLIGMCLILVWGIIPNEKRPQ